MKGIEVGSIVFNDWKVVKEIGTGAYSTVYLIEKYTALGQEASNPRAALKVIYLSKNRNKHFRQQIEEEVSIMTLFSSHPNIVHFEDYNYVPDKEDPDAVFIIKMEILAPLNRIEYSWKVDQVLDMGMDICNALEACENVNVIHRDIKPQNILRSSFGQYELGDFGGAIITKRPVSGVAGTYAYMAPEVANHQMYNQNIDLYSLGIILYQFLNDNRLPFMNVTADKVTREQLELADQIRFRGDPIPPVKKLDDELNRILLKVLAFDPQKRYQNAAALKKDLQKYKKRIVNIYDTVSLEPPVPPETPVSPGPTVPPNGVDVYPTVKPGHGGNTKRPPVYPGKTIDLSDYPQYDDDDVPPPPKKGINPFLLAALIALITACISVAMLVVLKNLIPDLDEKKIETFVGTSVFDEEFLSFESKMEQKGYTVEVRPAADGNAAEAGRITEYSTVPSNNDSEKDTIIYFYISAPDVTNYPQETAINMLVANGWDYSIVTESDCSSNPVDDGYVTREELDESNPSTVILHVYTK